jgi:hypothetical protein
MQPSLPVVAPHFKYNLVNISGVDYNIFLRQINAEEKIFAILGNFVADITGSTESTLERERYKNQLRILAQLRSLAPINLEAIMESVSTFFKEENDILYMVGERRGLKKGLEKGLEKGRREGRQEIKQEKVRMVKNLLTQTDFSFEKMAQIANTTVDFVKKVKESMR